MNFIKIFVFLILFSFVNAKPLTKVTLQLSWFNQFQFAGYYMAKEKGFYKEAGLDVEIIPFKFGLDIPKLIDESKVDFAIGRENLILAISHGKNIQLLYAIFQNSPLILLSTKQSGIKTIKDFKNKNIMLTKGDSNEITIKAMIASKGIKENDFNILSHSHNINDLIEKKTDIISAYISKSPYTLKKKDVEYNLFSPTDYGFDLYSDFLYTNKFFAIKNPELVNTFKNASLKGWEYAYNNIDESINHILKNYNTQNLSKEELKYEAQQLKKLSYSKNKKLGEIKKEKLIRIYDLYNIIGKIENPMELNFENLVFKLRTREINLTQKEKIYLENKNISYCVHPDAKPYSSITNKQAQGFISDYSKLLEKKLHKKMNLIPTKTWKESLKFAKERKCDILLLGAKNKERLEYLNFSKPYFDVTQVLVTRNTIPYVNNLKELKNVKIGLIKKYPLKKMLEKKYPNINFISVNSIGEGLEKVHNKELFGQITILKGVWFYLEGKYLSKLKISSVLDKKIKISVGIRNDDKLLYSIITKAVNSSLNTKELKEMKIKWFSTEYETVFDLNLLYKILFIIFIILFFILYKQYLLKKSNIKLNLAIDKKTKELEDINKTLEFKIKEAVEENQKKDKMISQQAKLISMGEMIQNIAHQWRQPLSIISVGASGLKLKKELDDLDDKTFNETLNSIIKSTTYLSNTIEDFMNFFKPTKEKKHFNLSHTIEKSVELISSKLINQNIKIITDIEDINIYGYESEFMQIIMNMFTNSYDAFKEKNITNKLIIIKIFKKANKSYIQIKDNAGGIDESIMDNIFEPYFTTKHKKNGTGIGLYMSSLIISKYLNGIIKVKNKNFRYENQEYFGAQFTIILEEYNKDLNEMEKI